MAFLRDMILLFCKAVLVNLFFLTGAYMIVRTFLTVTFLVFGSGAYMGGRGCFNIAKERKWEKKK